ncbi:MAG TPA: hypothetical protein VMW30_00660 [Candidatus Paceibacterota bacterium]|nr:hypothetical protein [Candidatus Paceibacterota bacterium]
MTLDPEPITPSQLYDNNLEAFRRLQEEVEYSLKAAVDLVGIETQSLISRIKSKASFLEKVDRKAYAAPTEEIEDIVGVRVVCLFLSDMPRLKSIIRETFTVVDEDDKVEGGTADSFGYMSVHFVCVLLAENVGPRYQGLHGMKFEVQCRTILQDAWANVSHRLAYKGEASIPEPLRKDFHALAGLFYVADKHFELFFLESLGSRAEAVESLKQVGKATDFADLPINRDTVEAFLAARFPDRESAPLEITSEFVEELVAVGYSTIRQLAIDIDRATEAVEAYENDSPPKDGETDEYTRYAGVGFARTALGFSNSEYAALKYEHWTDEDVAKYRRLVT